MFSANRTTAPDRTTSKNNLSKNSTCGISTGVQRCRDNGTKHNNVQEQPCRRTAPVKSVETQALEILHSSPFPGNGPQLRGTPDKTKGFSLHSLTTEFKPRIQSPNTKHTNQLDNTILIAPRPPSSLTTEFKLKYQSITDHSNCQLNATNLTTPSRLNPRPPSSLTTEFDFLEQCHQPM